MRHLAFVAVLSVVTLSIVSGTAPAGEPDDGVETYTPEELSALDRALHAVNMDRHDLTFKKDMTKGYACLEIVRAMLADPMLIAPEMDSLVGRAVAIDREVGAPLGSLVTARDCFENPMPLSTPVLKDPAARFDILNGYVRLHEENYGVPGGTPAELVAWLGRLVSSGGNPLWLDPPADADEDAEEASITTDSPDYRALRRYLPEQMDWHEVFASPYPEDVEAAIKTDVESRKEEWLHELGARIRVANLVDWWIVTFGDPVQWLGDLPATAFPTDEPLITETPYGRVALGTPGDDVYTGEFAALVDPGGNDRYVDCRIGTAFGTANRRVGFFADLGGDDVYACAEVDLTLGAAVLGIAAFYDLGAGNDLYQGGHGSLAAAFGGVAVFYDDGGSDVYEGKTFTQGAAGFGVAVLADDSVQAAPEMTTDEGTKDPVDIGLFDNDRFSAWANAQAFARCRGVAVLSNRRGNEIYEAGGVYLDAPLFADRYQSFSQGFAIGERGVDYAGGIALLVDLDGNDRYLGDIYNQGVGYWYSAGLLYDGGGNDTYEMTQYGQGSGIHLAVGGLIDVSGHDTYVMHSGLGQGGSHDYAASILHDRGGDDRYLGNTSCNGCGLTNAVGIHIDRSGNDVYAGRLNGGMNSGRPARGFGSIGVLLDLSGKDSYLGILTDDGAARRTDVGVGLDLPTPAPESAPASTPNQVTGRAEVPEVCRYEGELTRQVFDELWAIAIRWEVGDNRVIVPEARKRIAAFGTPVLVLLRGKVEQRASGLEFRAFVDVLKQLREAGAEEAVIGFLRDLLADEGERPITVGLYLTGELRAAALADEVALLLASEQDGIARRAAGVLGALGSDTGNDVLTAWLAPAGDERRIQAAITTLLLRGAPVWDQLRPLLDHPLMSVRSMLATSLAAHAEAYADVLRAALLDPDLSPRALRTLLDAFARSKLVPGITDVAAVAARLDSEDFGQRADAARVLRKWAGQEAAGARERDVANVILTALLLTEEDPYVRFCAAPEKE